jgi:hypothetical protein
MVAAPEEAHLGGMIALKLRSERASESAVDTHDFRDQFLISQAESMV